MKQVNVSPAQQGKLIIKKCHCCGHLNETFKEIKRCTGCKKSFLPANYFGKVHAQNDADYENLYANSEELREEDLVKGINVLW
tara:strand:- start:66007 stop:66255 length:249 start_codon:yes stop_codon:yes gene_type:complete